MKNRPTRSPTTTILKTTIRDDSAPDDEPRDIDVTIELSPDHIAIGFKGYGTSGMAPGHGFPVVIGNDDGFPMIRLWSNINREDETFSISLEKAQERLRKDVD